MTATALAPGLPYPLGATPRAGGVNFVVFSANATRIEVCVYDQSGRNQIARYALRACVDHIWHGLLPDAGAGLLYGLRAQGPFAPDQGHRFNANKLLLDPYARE